MLPRHLPPADRTDRRSVNRRHRDKEILRQMLGSGTARTSRLGGRRRRGDLAEINRSPDELDALLERQNYRLAFWQMAKQDLDYRRFFDINTLVGLRMEDDRVFADTHALVLHWLKRRRDRRLANRPSRRTARSAAILSATRDGISGGLDRGRKNSDAR